jgi:hypothetical protein
LTGALPYITEDCTVTRQSGSFEITENISYDKLLNSDLYEYLGKEEIQQEQAEPVPEIAEDSLTFSFGSDNKFFTESDLMADFAEKNPDISFALANAVFDYLDEKQHSEREIPELNAGWYKKTDFAISAVINGEDFNYEGRFDIGDGKGAGGGSLIDHIRDFCEGVVKSNQYPFNTPESNENAQRNLDVFIPFLEEHSMLTEKEQQILFDFKAENPIRTENDIEKDKSEPTVSVAENKGPVTMRKVGDFYEMYGKNAQIAADVLDLHLTTKNGSEMVGFPDFKKQEYAGKLQENGYSVLVEEVYEINPPQSDLDKAKQLISEYCKNEFESNADFSDLSRVDLAFTTDEETEMLIQVYADLENFRMVKEYDGTVVNEEQFDSLEDMCEKALQNFDFSDLTSLSDEEKVKVQTAENDIDTPLFTDVDVIDEIQKNEHSAEEKPFWEQSDIQGEQLSLFGDSEPIKFEKFNPQKKAEPVKHGGSNLFVGNVNIMTALHDEIMRGSGFQDGKFRIQKFYEDNKPDTKEFAKMLRDEYGTGGHSADKPIAFVNHDSKGMEFQIRNDDGSLSDEKLDFCGCKL